MNEDGETVVLFPENPQSEAEKQDTTPSKKQQDDKKTETDQKQDTDTKKDPEKQPDQKEPELTEDSLSELPMVPLEG